MAEVEFRRPIQRDYGDSEAFARSNQLVDRVLTNRRSTRQHPNIKVGVMSVDRRHQFGLERLGAWRLSGVELRFKEDIKCSGNSCYPRLFSRAAGLRVQRETAGPSKRQP